MKLARERERECFICMAAEAGDISKVLNFGHLSVTVPQLTRHT